MAMFKFDFTCEETKITIEEENSSKINGGLFIALYDEDSLKLYLDKGLYGFLMTHKAAIMLSSQTMLVVEKVLMCFSF